MKSGPQKHHRTSTRLKGYDYSLAGAYFITAVTYQREMLFGEIVHHEMKLNRRGEIVQAEWFASTNIRREIRLFPEEFVVMPNHIHGIVWILDDENASAVNLVATVRSNQIVAEGRVGATGQSPLLQDGNHPRGPARKSLSSFMAGFKSSVTKRIRDELNETGIWQRNYHDRIIRNEQELDAIRRYIEYNPRNWAEDDENPRVGK